MANTYTLISSNVLTGSAASVTFSSIPSTYTDLVVRASVRTDDTGFSYIQFRFNSDTATNYSDTVLEGNGSAASSTRASSATYVRLIKQTTSSNTASTFGSFELYIPSYTASQNKPLSIFSVNENNSASTNTYIDADAGLWRNTAAITDINIAPSSAMNFVSGSSFYLYGIKNS